MQKLMAGTKWRRSCGKCCAVIVVLLCMFIPDLHGQSFLPKVESPEDYARLKGKPAVRKYGRVESVKVVWEKKKDRFFFLNAEEWEWHYDFCHSELGFWQQRFVFNQQAYSDSREREFMVGNVNHYPDAGFWTLELSPSDQLRHDLIIGFYFETQKHLFSGDSLALFLNTERLEHWFGADTTSIPVIRPENIYAEQLYQPLVQGRTCGYLRKISVEELKDKYPGTRDIVLVNGTPLDIPATAGVITNQFQTPLSHLNVLCQNRKTPFFAHRNIWEDPAIDSLEWELVCIDVGPDHYKIEKAELEEAQRFWESKTPRKTLSLEKRLNRKSLVSQKELNHTMVHTVGGKAANFGTLARIAKKDKNGFLVPEKAFGIPFYWYEDHLTRSGADSMIKAVLTNAQIRNDPRELEIKLKEIRSRIKKHPVNPEVIEMINKEAGPGRHRLRFRSSTNAEDVDGFNGAGLYTSKTGWVNAPEEKKQVNSALRKVWASVWNFRAFSEREYFGIKHEDVAMGILVHRSFPSETANGVAITKNLYRESYYGFVVNVQVGEISVVSPPEGVTCDQLICYSEADLSFFKKREIVEYIAHSNQIKGNSVLTKDQVVFLTEQLARIKKYYYWNVGGYSRKYDYKDFALDIEFKIDGPEDKLYIKQVRVYND